jgi:hypothetical protein
MPQKLTDKKKALLVCSLGAAAYLLTRNDVPDAVKKVVNPIRKALMGDRSLPRGLRNNNPLNLRKGVRWVGRTGDDGAFDIFSSMYYGWRAGLHNFKTQYTKYGCTTISKLINRWAPPSENDTAKYIRFVANESGFGQDALIQLSDKETIAKILWAMAQMENGPEIAKKRLTYAELLRVVNQY